MKTIWEDSAKIVLEIPHRGEPASWFATDEKDFQDKLISGFTGSEEESFSELLHEGVGDEDPVNEVTTGQLLDIAGSDLSRFIVFDTLDEARNYALVDRGQGFVKVYRVLNDWDLLIFERANIDGFHSIEEIAAEIDGKDYHSYLIAGTYAIEAAEESSFGVGKDNLEAQLEFLKNAGANFDITTALSIAQEILDEEQE
tara:strand:+ start:93 stop:689 length:597 start_codon:yes stop_codon:yes gene_type:complete